MPNFRPSATTLSAFGFQLYDVPTLDHTTGLCHSHDVLDRVLEFVDDALLSAALVKNKTSEIDKKFETAIDILSKYETAYHPSDGCRTKTVPERMEAATAKEKSISAILERLKEGLKVRVAHPALPR